MAQPPGGEPTALAAKAPEPPAGNFSAIMEDMRRDPLWQALLNVYDVHQQELLELRDIMRQELSEDEGGLPKVFSDDTPIPSKDTPPAAARFAAASGHSFNSVAASKGGLTLPSRSLDLQRHASPKSSRHSLVSGDTARKRRQESPAALERRRSSQEPSSSGFSGEESDMEVKEAFPMRDAWLLLNREKSRFYTKENSLSGPMFVKAGLLSISTESEKEKSKGCISPPWSPWRIAWDVTGGLLLLHDFVALPMAVFHPPPTTIGTFLEWLSAVFWTLNILASMTVGFMRNGVAVMEFTLILKNYIKTWFIPDLALVLLDWLSLSLPAEQSVDDSTDFLRLVRLLRIIRIVRLIRMLKLRTLLATFHDLINSEYWSLVANMSQIVFFMLGINHLVACGFYGLADLARDTEVVTWVKHYGFEGQSWSYNYASALHWAITQFTPAAMDVHPTNMIERTYTITVVVFAMVGFSSLVGGITSILTQLRGLSQEKAKELWKLRRYMRLKHVPMGLNVRIQRYVEHAWNERQMNLSIGSVKFVELLSEPLRDELLCAVDMPPLIIHPLFKYLYQEQEVTIHRLVTHATKHKLLARGDIHFYAAEVATHAYFVVSGQQSYTQYPPRVAHVMTREIERGKEWVGEPVLWANDWVHTGSVQAVSESDLMALDPEEVAKALTSNPPAWREGAQYAQEFTMWLNNQHHNDVCDILSTEDLADVFDELKNRGSAITGREKQPPQSERANGFARRLSAVMPVMNTS